MNGPRYHRKNTTREKRNDLAKKAYERAYFFEGEYGSCPQAVLSAIQDVLGGIDDEVITAGHNLAGGAALSGQGTCGALVGGMMALSVNFGRPRTMFGRSACMKNHELAKKLFDRFVERYGSPLCSGVQTRIMGRPYDLWDRKDYAEFDKAGAHRDKCTEVAGSVAEWTAELIVEHA